VERIERVLAAEKPDPEPSSAQIATQNAWRDGFDAAPSGGKVYVQESAVPACRGVIFH
jgi:hypothetical protein